MLTIDGLIAVLALIGTVFGLGYTFGYYHGKSQK